MSERRKSEPSTIDEHVRMWAKLREGVVQSSIERAVERDRLSQEAMQADRQSREAAERRLFDRRLALALTALPPAMRAALVSTLEMTDAARAALGWLSGSGRVLVLGGGVGVGKSVAAAMALQAAALSGRFSVTWHRPADFASGVLHGHYDENAPRIGRDLVVVDDAGRETRTDLCEALCAVIDDTATRIIVTTNLSEDDFAERYDVRLTDRLKECGEHTYIPGASRRKAGG